MIESIGLSFLIACGLYAAWAIVSLITVGVCYLSALLELALDKIFPESP